MWATPSILDSDTWLNQASYYEATTERGAALPALAGAQRADVVVVGGGFAGLSAAIELGRRGLQVVLLEAERICGGASGRNGGQALVGYASGQEAFETRLGREAAHRAWDLSLEGIELIDRRIAEFAIDCDRVKGYLHVADSPRKARALEQEMRRSERLYGLASQWIERAALRDAIDSPRYHAGAYETVSGHLHPLRYGLGLARAARALGVRMHEHSPVVALARGRRLLARSTHGTVQADFALLAGNCTLAEYGPQLAPEIGARIMPVGTYALATEPLGQAVCARLIARRAAVCDNNFALDYFRCSADHRLLFGGGVSYTTRTPRRLAQSLRARMLRVFPQLEAAAVSHVWGGFVDISMNRMPDFGRLGDNVYYLQGFSGHGVAVTGLAGQLVAQAIAGQAERFDLFAAIGHRPFPGGARLRTPTLALAMWYRQLFDRL